MSTTDRQSDAKERRLRQWAARIVSELPPDEQEARKVLRLAQQLAAEWLPADKRTGRKTGGVP